MGRVIASDRMTQQILTATAALIVCFGTPASANDKKSKADTAKPTVDIRSPKKGDKLGHSFRVKGRTKNVPEGHMVVVFRSVEGEDEFMFPCTKPFRGNRAFTETVEHQKTDRGDHSVEVRSMPADIAKKLNKWREEIIDWHKRGGKGKKPDFTVAWLEQMKTLGWVEYKLGK